MAEFIGPVVSYQRNLKWKIWENVPLNPLFQEAIFLTMTNESDKVTWRGDKYTMEQTSIRALGPEVRYCFHFNLSIC